MGGRKQGVGREEKWTRGGGQPQSAEAKGTRGRKQQRTDARGHKTKRTDAQQGRTQPGGARKKSRTATERAREAGLADSARTTAYQPPSGWTFARPKGTQPLTAPKQPPSGWTCARSEGTQALPATKLLPSGWTCRRPAATLQTHNRAHQVCTAVIRRQVAQDTAHTAQHTGRAQR